MRKLSVLVICLLILPVGKAGADMGARTELVSALQSGGYTIYFRHAATDWSQSDQVYAAGDWQSCNANQMRQLSEAGRLTAMRVGDAMRVLAIPVGEILSSEYCRAVETAKGLNLGRIRTTTDVMNLLAADYVGGREMAIARLQSIISTPPKRGTNRVIIGHGNLSREATGAYPGEAGAVVLVADPSMKQGFKVIDQLEPSDWRRLAQLASKSQ